MTERTCHFICSLGAIEALGGFLSPSLGNGKRRREFVERYPIRIPAKLVLSGS